jgi:hypothetical protein
MLTALRSAPAIAFPQGRDVDGEDALLDERVRPDFREQFGLGHEPACATCQGDQHVERLRRQMHRGRAAREHRSATSSVTSPNT